MRLGLDLALGREPGAQQRRPHGLAEPTLGEKQEVVVRPAHHAHRRDDPPLRRQQQRVARRLRDVVREHPLEEILGIRPAHADEVPLPFRDGHCELV